MLDAKLEVPWLLLVRMLCCQPHPTPPHTPLAACPACRAGAGGKQSSKDATGKYAKSAGSRLRRYNEAALERDIHELLASWQEHLRVGSTSRAGSCLALCCHALHVRSRAVLACCCAGAASGS